MARGRGLRSTLPLLVALSISLRPELPMHCPSPTQICYTASLQVWVVHWAVHGVFCQVLHVAFLGGPMPRAEVSSCVAVSVAVKLSSLSFV